MLSGDVEFYLRLAKGAYNSWKSNKKPIGKYGSEEEKAYYTHQRKCTDACKKWIKDAIQQWLKENLLTGFITIDGLGNFYGKDHFSIDAITIHNGKGSVVKKNNWINKITVIRNEYNTWEVRTHRVNTDSGYLHPAEENFLHFVEEMYQLLQS